MRESIQNQRFQVQAAAGDSGFTVTSVRDLQNRREWIYTDSSFTGERNGDRSYDEQYGGGMEFLFPSDEKEIYKGKCYADHGVLWRMPYQVKREADTLRAEGFHAGAGIRAVWNIMLTDSFILQKLYICNESAETFPFLIRLHPSFLLERDTVLNLHEKQILYEPDGANCSFKPDSRVADQIDISDPGTWKAHDLFFHIRQKKGEFTITQKDRSLRVEYESETFPFLTVCSFMKEGKRIGILEPANVPGISLGSAQRFGSLPLFKPGEIREYTFRLIPQ